MRYTPMHTDSMDIPSVLNAIRKAAKVKQSGLGEIIGVSQPQISRYMQGAEPRKPAYDKIMAAAKQYGVDNPADIRSEDVAAELDGPPPQTIKVKGYVGAGGEAHYYAVAQGDLDEIGAKQGDPPNAAAVEIMGTSLGLFFDRWHAIYNDVRSPVTEDLIGKLCVVGLDDDRVLIKKIERSGRKFNLLSNSTEEPPIKDVIIRWAAKVTDVRPK